MANKNNGLKKRNTQTLRHYVEFYLADVCFDYNTLIEEIKENKLHPGRNHKPEERIAFLQKLADEQVDCIGWVIADLKRLK
ncbi:MAG: hypothetical protein PHQ35_06005 [Phycisphaerae bacterium]|nr:hypothetical protein [Phycisphaerae bacterium]MDD5381268.1 hypothetical protein [Phycisphaerae bacterium]